MISGPRSFTKPFLCTIALFSLLGCSSNSRPGSDPAPPIAQVDESNAITKKDEFLVKFTTTKGDFLVLVHRKWAPIGAERFYTLLQEQYYDDCAFFRVIKDFVVQFGVNGTPEVTDKWRNSPIPDEPSEIPNKRGTITFASLGPNTRSAQIFINYDNNMHLNGDYMPFAEVIEGMGVVDSFNDEYGRELAMKQLDIMQYGNRYLKELYPNVDYVKTARIIEENGQPYVEPEVKKTTVEPTAETSSQGN